MKTGKPGSRWRSGPHRFPGFQSWTSFPPLIAARASRVACATLFRPEKGNEIRHLPARHRQHMGVRCCRCSLARQRAAFVAWPPKTCQSANHPKYVVEDGTEWPLLRNRQDRLNGRNLGALLTQQPSAYAIRSATLPFLPSIRNAKMPDVQQPIFDAPRAVAVPRAHTVPTKADPALDYASGRKPAFRIPLQM